MFSLSGSCVLFLLCFIASCSCGVVSVMLYPCIFSVALFGLCVACLIGFVNLLVKQFTYFFWVWLLLC